MSDQDEGARLYLEHCHANEAGEPERAAKALLKSARLGEPMAIHALAYSADVKGETARALRLYRKAAEAGASYSAFNLARHYEAKHNRAAYIRWLMRSAELGDEDAVEELAGLT